MWVRSIGALHHPASQGGIQRRQPQRPIFKDLHQLSPHAKQQYRTKLGI